MKPLFSIQFYLTLAGVLSIIRYNALPKLKGQNIDNENLRN